MRQYQMAWLLLALLVGCASMTRPETFRQQVAYVEGGLTAAYQTIGQMKREGRIDAPKRDRLVAQADTVGLALDATHAALGQGNEPLAVQNLKLARAALVTLEQALKE